MYWRKRLKATKSVFLKVFFAAILPVVVFSTAELKVTELCYEMCHCAGNGLSTELFDSGL